MNAQLEKQMETANNIINEAYKKYDEIQDLKYDVERYETNFHSRADKKIRRLKILAFIPLFVSNP